MIFFYTSETALKILYIRIKVIKKKYEILESKKKGRISPGPFLFLRNHLQFSFCSLSIGQ